MKLLAIDGNSIINRAFYGIKLLTTKSGTYTNGIVGFMNILNKLIDMEAPQAIVIGFDLRAKTFRHKAYSEYKAGRKGMPDELAEQMPVLKKLLCLLGYTCLELEGFEADDILGTLSKICEQNGSECVIATGDRDALQLVSDKTKVLLSTTKMGGPQVISFTPDEVMDKYGVLPRELIDIKALQGDASDNIPGVAGIGEKTAGDLISRFHNIDYIYENLETLEIKEPVRNKLRLGKDNAYMSRYLGTVNCTVPIESNIESYITKPFESRELYALLSDLEMFKLIEKLGISGEPSLPFEAETSLRVKSADILELTEKIDCVFDEEKLNLQVKSANSICNITDISEIKKIFSGGRPLRVYNSKAIYKWCMKQNIDINNIVFDSQLAAYLVNPSLNDYDLVHLAAMYSYEINDENIACVHSEICDKLENEMNELGQKKLLEEIELPLAKVLAKMELDGFLVDTKGISEYGQSLALRISEIQATVWQEVGYEFNLNSPKQLGEALFERLGLPAKKKTKSGYSTGAEVLEGLKYAHPAVEHLLEYRQLTKLKSTYCDGLLNAVGADGRIRSTLNQTETRTGRISSTEPNLQNIPVRKPEGRQLRGFFKAADGFMLCDADYSQIELRVLAHIADDKTMIGAFNAGTDIHAMTAGEVFDMPQELVTPLMRSRAKAVNFGIVYGIGAFSLAKDIGVTNAEAATYIKGYLNTYKGVRDYMTRVVEQAKEDGFVTTMWGRRRLLPEIKNSNGMLRAFGERVARNMPIQGAAADIIKIAMIKVSNRLEKELPEARLIMQVHDELIVEAPEDKTALASIIIKEEMESAANLKVPMLADVHCGKTWLQAKE